MKRLILAILIVLSAVPASAFDAEKRSDRIAILHVTAEGRPGEATVGAAMAQALRNRLRRAGLDAFTLSSTWDEVQDDPRDDVDFYVELAPWDADSDPYGGVGVNGPHAGIDIAVVRSSVAAQLRVYDARTFQLLGQHDLTESSTAVLPVGIGVGHRAVYGWVAVPFAQWMQYRRITRRMAEDAAAHVVDIVRNPA
jgi:hypothetical protein